MLGLARAAAAQEATAPPAKGADIRAAKVNLVTEEVVGQIADGAAFKFWAFNGKLPGPMVAHTSPAACTARSWWSRKNAGIARLRLTAADLAAIAERLAARRGIVLEPQEA